jgi:hypothetical protein
LWPIGHHVNFAVVQLIPESFRLFVATLHSEFISILRGALELSLINPLE